MNIDWSKAPPHATHWCPGNAKMEAGWIYNPGGNGGEFYSCYADKGLEHIPEFPGWQKLRLVPRPSKTAWDGEGLPPVGTVCEVLWSSTTNDYVCCLVIAHDEGRAVYRFTSGSRKGEYGADDTSDPFDVPTFRPIRTPEQIAADNRLHEIRNALSAINSKVHFPNDLVGGNILAAAVAAMIDAGYRKPVTP
ncbi:hypothetical protein [Pseudomonas sp. D3-10]|uniref:hypothetical protein n=1 Tax=Pseudomonas sp. D3-10 TaxID=2817392 RepID=UPI003DAA1B29